MFIIEILRLDLRLDFCKRKRGDGKAISANGIIDSVWFSFDSAAHSRHEWLKLIHKGEIYMHTAVLYIHSFLALAFASDAREGQRRFLKVKSIMHEGPRAKPKSLKL